MAVQHAPLWAQADAARAEDLDPPPAPSPPPSPPPPSPPPSPPPCDFDGRVNVGRVEGDEDDGSLEFGCGKRIIGTMRHDGARHFYPIPYDETYYNKNIIMDTCTSAANGVKVTLYKGCPLAQAGWPEAVYESETIDGTKRCSSVQWDDAAPGTVFNLLVEGDESMQYTVTMQCEDPNIKASAAAGRFSPALIFLIAVIVVICCCFAPALKNCCRGMRMPRSTQY